MSAALLRDKILGCWAGKNIGGTLGGPLEEAYGRAEPFDVWWYPELREGGIPNDDLEMQLVWLKAVEEIGPKLRARDLAQYWLENIGYNYDEYGLSKTNLRLGLLPPVSGAYNNWFRDCMGCPIRSEIWACLAPGRPNVAARMAYEDAICDHAGGESVFGELFNVAMQSAAFVEDDVHRLIDVGLSYIPEGSKTAAAVNEAVRAFREGRDWLEARQAVLAAVPHWVAQYSPINLGFQTIGLLYGRDFGDAICKAVNCGYDTDCTGATVGATLGIILGRSGLPANWMEPIGESIITSEASGGLRHLSDSGYRVPETLDELATRVVHASRAVLAAYPVDDYPFALSPDATVEKLWTAEPYEVTFAGEVLDVTVDYRGDPTITPGQVKTVGLFLSSRRPVSFRGTLTAIAPTGWACESVPSTFELKPFERMAVELRVSVAEGRDIGNSTVVLVGYQVEDRPAERPIPIVLIGATQYRWAGPYGADTADSAVLGESYQPEMGVGSPVGRVFRTADWRTVFVAGDALPFGELSPRAGTYYVQTYLWSAEERAVWIGASVSCPYKLWLNQSVLASRAEHAQIRPNYSGQGQSYAGSRLLAGWNEVLIKLVRGSGSVADEGYLMISDPDDQYAGLAQVGRSRMPWD